MFNSENMARNYRGKTVEQLTDELVAARFWATEAAGNVNFGYLLEEAGERERVAVAENDLRNGYDTEVWVAAELQRRRLPHPDECRAHPNDVAQALEALQAA